MKPNKTLRGQIQEGDVLVDDVGESYLVIEVFNNSVAVSPINNWQNLACEIMSYHAMDNEGWAILNKKLLPKEL